MFDDERDVDEPRRPAMVMPSITRDPDGKHRPVILPDDDEAAPTQP